MNSPRTFFGTAGELVPAVDAEDLQSAYEILTDPRPAGWGWARRLQHRHFQSGLQSRRRHFGG